MSTDTAVTDVLRTTDSQIDEAVSDANFDALGTMLADDFLYTHASGSTETKSVWINGLTSGNPGTRRVSSEVIAEIHGDIGIVTGDLEMIPVGRPTLGFRYMRVYRSDDGQWKAISQRNFWRIPQ